MRNHTLGIRIGSSRDGRHMERYQEGRLDNRDNIMRIDICKYLKTISNTSGHRNIVRLNGDITRER